MRKSVPLEGRTQESRQALQRAREQMAVLCVLVGRMANALRTVGDDTEDELGSAVGPAAVQIADGIYADVWLVDSIGESR